jgi:PAS domain S-box-containing protein
MISTVPGRPYNSNAPSSSAPDPRRDEPAKVLIVDDNAGNLDALEAMLGSSQCSLVRALSADEALLALLSHEFAAMILDIRMPDISGIDLARMIKQRRRNQHVPILFLTAHMAEEREVLLGYGAGAVDYLSKPIDAGILRSKIGVFIDLFQKTRELARVNEALQFEIGERVKAQAALEESNRELELRVQERTAALVAAHQETRENEERLRMGAEVARMAAWDWNLRTDTKRWSCDPEQLFGFPPGTLGLGMRLSSVLHADDRTGSQEAVDRALRTGRFEHECRAVRADGTIVWITERGRLVRGENGEPERIVGISRDVSSERMAEHERERILASEKQAKEEALRQSRIKDDFVANLSHELRTPMNLILGWINLLSTGDLKDARVAIEVIQRSAQLQAKLIEDLLDMSALSVGNFHLEMATIDVLSVIQASVRELQPIADARGVRLSAEVDPEAHSTVGDRRRLKQILWNLLTNAIKFNRAGGHVDVRARLNRQALEISVEDNGKGISADFLPHIFERFRQRDSSTTREAGGLGLGLSIARQLAELHGGSIEASSPGEDLGSTFVVRLPAVTAAHL